MFRPFVAALTCVSITFASPALAEGRRNNDDVARALAGLAAIAIIGAAISDNNRGRTSPPPRPQPQPEPPRWSNHDYRNDRLSPLPEHCRSEVRFGRDRTDVYAEQCLNRSYADAWRLPQECRVTYDSRDGRWTGYDANCVERQGRRRH